MRRFSVLAASLAATLACVYPASAASGTVSHSYVGTGAYSATLGAIEAGGTCEPQIVNAPSYGDTCFTGAELSGATSVDISISALVSPHVAAVYELFDPSSGTGYGPPHVFCDSVSNVSVVAAPSTTTEVFVWPVTFTDGGPCAGTAVAVAGTVTVTLH